MTQQDRPNIVWLLTDHVPYKHHGANGGPAPTFPAYERLARQGISFSQATTVCPLCQPARASMLTGLYPHHHGMVHNSGHLGARKEFEPDAKLFSHYLRAAGYRTGYFGKWHCGIERTATDYEFEGWTLPDYGHPYNKDAYKEYLERNHLPQATVDVEGAFGNDSLKATNIRLCDEPHEYHRMQAWGVLKTPPETHEAYFVCDMAARWLEQAVKTRDPFALRVDVWGPHQPYWSAAPYAGTVDPSAIPEYPNFRHTLDDRPAFQRAMRDNQHRDGRWDTWQEWQPMLARCYEHATQVDMALTRILDLLDRLGIADNTLVIYAADHGDAIASHGGIFDKGSFMVEETMRIPLALRWPGHIAPGNASPHFVTNMDIVPTVLAAAGADMPPMDGRSLLPLATAGAEIPLANAPSSLTAATGQKANVGRASRPSFPPHADQPLPLAEAPWRDTLLCQHYGHGQDCFQRLLRHKQYKYIAHLGDIEELYDLAQDPYELTNLAATPTSRDLLKDMREKLLMEMETVDDNDEKAQRLKRQVSS